MVLKYCVIFPNLLTMSRIALVPLIGMCLVLQGWYTLVGIALFTLAVATDFYDGYFARKYGVTSVWGAFFDPLADKVLVFGVMGVLYILGLVPRWFLVIIVVRDIVITALRWILVRRHIPLVTSRLAKIKTSMQFAVLYYLMICWFIIDNDSTIVNWRGIKGVCVQRGMYVAMGAVAIVTVYSACDYLWANRNALRKVFGTSRQKTFCL